MRTVNFGLWISDLGGVRKRLSATRTLVSRVPRVLLCQYGVFTMFIIF